MHENHLEIKPSRFVHFFVHLGKMPAILAYPLLSSLQKESIGKSEWKVVKQRFKLQ